MHEFSQGPDSDLAQSLFHLVPLVFVIDGKVLANYIRESKGLNITILVATLNVFVYLMYS